jgi:3-oxoacyl-[acyl-carrier-protein] synthase-3
MRAFISGTGSYIPERVVTNEEVCRNAAGTSDEWIRSKLGIVTRHVASPDEQASDLAAHASRRAVEAAHLKPDDIDGILCAVNTGDVHLPATASYLQQKLGIRRHCFAMDVKVACAGAVGCIMMARGLIESGMAKNVLVTGIALISRTALDWTDRRTAPIFGDGSGAVVVSASPDDGHAILQSRFYTDGSEADVVGQLAGGSRMPMSAQVLADKRHLLHMDGKAVWESAVRHVPEVIREVVAAGGFTLDQVDFVVTHQANHFMIMHILKVLGVPRERTLTNVERYGNTGAAGALIALDESVRAGHVQPGKLVVLAAIGAGMTWGAHLVRW